jgi:hypothetical protein
MQYQAALQLAQQAPQLYDMGKLHRQMLEVLGISDAKEIIKLPDEVSPADPVTENMRILQQEPVKVFKYQDHEAHIQVHMSFMQDPKIQQLVGQSPFAQAIQNSITSHITEHVAMLYRNKIEKELGVSMPDEDAPLPEDVELELSRVSREAAQALLGKNQAEMQQQKAAEQQADPLTQIQQAELKMKQDELQHRINMDMQKFELDKLSKIANVEVQRERLDSEEEREQQRLASQERIKTAEVRVKGAEIGAKLTSEEEKNKTATKKIRADLLKEGLKTGKGLADDATNGE